MRRFSMVPLLVLLAYGPTNAQDVIIYHDAPTAEDILRDLGELPKTRSWSAERPSRSIVSTGTGLRYDSPSASSASPRPSAPVSPAVRPSAERPKLVGDKWIAAMVQFELNSHVVRTSQFDVIDRVAEVMGRKPDFNLVISGHADKSGSDSINIPLSARRAAAVREHLMLHHGIAAERMTLRGVGSDEPLTGYNEYDPINRRVQFGFQR